MKATVISLAMVALLAVWISSSFAEDADTTEPKVRARKAADGESATRTRTRRRDGEDADGRRRGRGRDADAEDGGRGRRFGRDADAAGKGGGRALPGLTIEQRKKIAGAMADFFAALQKARKDLLAKAKKILNDKQYAAFKDRHSGARGPGLPGAGGMRRGRGGPGGRGGADADDDGRRGRRRRPDADADADADSDTTRKKRPARRTRPVVDDD